MKRTAAHSFGGHPRLVEYTFVKSFDTADVLSYMVRDQKQREVECWVSVDLILEAPYFVDVVSPVVGTEGNIVDVLSGAHVEFLSDTAVLALNVTTSHGKLRIDTSHLSIVKDAKWWVGSSLVAIADVGDHLVAEHMRVHADKLYLNAVLAALYVEPDASFNGALDIVLSVEESRGHGSTETVQVWIEAVNSPPTVSVGEKKAV